MAEAQQMVQLVNYFLHHHHQPALVHAFQKYISSHWRNMSWNLFFKLLLPLAPSTYQVYPALFTDCTTAALDHWAGDQGLTGHLYFHDDSKKPPGKYFLTKTMFQENPVLLQAFLQTIWKNDAEYTSSYVLNTDPSRLHQKIEVENGWDVVTGSRELSVCLSIS